MLLRYLAYIDRPELFIKLIFMFIVTGGIALLIGITVHEFSHALTAHRLGDNTAQRQGRLSLSPLVHLDPAGTMMLLLVGFGWGKPVPVNPYAFGRNAIKGMGLVAFAGPLSNVITAFLFSLPIKIGLIDWQLRSHSPLLLRTSFVSAEDFIATLLGFIIFYNLILAMFNLIPLAPLDGFKVALGILPKNLASSYARLERYGPGILLGAIALDYLTGARILGTILGPGVNFLASIVLGQKLL